MSDDVVVLKRPEELGRPSVGLHLLVKNGESVVGRLLDCVGPYLTEVVAVLNDTEDGTHDVLSERSAKHGLDLRVVQVTSATHPELYAQDEASSYQVGRPLAGEEVSFVYTGRPMLADWAGARNVGWLLHRAVWRLFLDADDLVADPECIPGLVDALGQRDVDVASSSYSYHVSSDGRVLGRAFRERLCRNRPEIVWEGAVHERLAGFDKRKVAHVEGTLRVSDMRDNRGEGTRIPDRNFKVLYLAARRAGWDVPPRDLAYLAAESARRSPDFCLAVADHYLRNHEWPEEASWVCCTAGEVWERRGKCELAERWYLRALEHHRSASAAYSLARVLFNQSRWRDVVSAYERGKAYEEVPQFLVGPTTRDEAVKILVAVALAKCGRVAEALAMCEEASRAFPNNLALRDLRAQLEAESQGTL